MNAITVLLVDDHTIVREGLRRLLETEGGFDIVGEAANGHEAVKMVQELHLAVVVLDLAMPQLNGLEAARRVLQYDAPPEVIILSAHNDDAYIEQVAMIGVRGYLIKQTSAHVLAKAIRDVCKGKMVYSPEVAKRLRNRRGESSRPRYRQALPRLTPREREVLQLIAEGRANKQVASDLGISIKTVEKHRQSVMDKLNVHDTAGLTRYAISAGIIESSVQCTII